jgi:hypothetical protein
MKVLGIMIKISFTTSPTFFSRNLYTRFRKKDSKFKSSEYEVQYVIQAKIIFIFPASIFFQFFLIFVWGNFKHKIWLSLGA